MDKQSAIERKLARLETLIIDSPNNWETREQVMQRFDVGSSTVDTWAKMYPEIFKYRKKKHDPYEDVLDRLFKILPKDECDKVFDGPECDIEPCFMGFVEIYEGLAKIIPQHYTVVDLGCAYNPQAYYFANHKEYLAVDISDCVKFQPPNCKIFHMSIEAFIMSETQKMNLSETFAICSYVPPWGGDNMKLVRDAFTNVFTFYPAGNRVKLDFSVTQD